MKIHLDFEFKAKRARYIKRKSLIYMYGVLDDYANYFPW